MFYPLPRVAGDSLMPHARHWWAVAVAAVAGLVVAAPEGNG